jgi:hypothetical protein
LQYAACEERAVNQSVNCGEAGKKKYLFHGCNMLCVRREREKLEASGLGWRARSLRVVVTGGIWAVKKED